MKAGAKLLITGADGQLGYALARLLDERFAVVGTNRSACDITNPEQVREVVEDNGPDAVLHCAAWTDVDGCEQDPDTAYRVNGQATARLADICAKTGTRLVYFSTDFVFDGEKGEPYSEADQPNPLNVYGRSKLAGEEAVRNANKDNVIVRVSWLYSARGRNFLSSMIQRANNSRAGKSEPIRVVDDQLSSPTWVNEVARQTAAILGNDLTGIIHAVAHGACSRYDMVTRLFDELGAELQVERCRAAEFPQAAQRPAYSALVNTRLQQAGIDVMRPWDTALREFLNQTRARVR
jgi:dTDP-4-dehydrorhamnose reductase